MKKLFVLIGCAFLAVSLSFGQAKKPTIMVVPSDAWCIQNGYVTEFDDQGTLLKIPNYKMALQNNTDLLLVISAINGMMTDRGFPLKNLESALKTMESDAAEDAMRSSSSSGEGVSESPIDALKKTAKADIIMQLTWTVSEVGPKKAITFVLTGLDAYSDKQVASAQGPGEPSFTADTPTLLQEAVTAHIDNFNAQLQSHFDDMFTNGREVVVRVQKWGDWDGELDMEFDGDELTDIIEDWMAANTVQGRFSSDVRDTQIVFEQVRIPLFDERGNATDTRKFVRELSKYLKAEPYLITSKVVMKGLGRATLILGSK